MFEEVHKVRVVYKSGYVQDFECTHFSITNNTYSWASANPYCNPILIGVDDIAAVWHVGSRKRFKWPW